MQGHKIPGTRKFRIFYVHMGVLCLVGDHTTCIASYEGTETLANSPGRHPMSFSRGERFYSTN